jgi:hypothetical protein
VIINQDVLPSDPFAKAASLGANYKIIKEKQCRKN